MELKSEAEQHASYLPVVGVAEAGQGGRWSGCGGSLGQHQISEGSIAGSSSSNGRGRRGLPPGDSLRQGRL